MGRHFLPKLQPILPQMGDDCPRIARPVQRTQTRAVAATGLALCVRRTDADEQASQAASPTSSSSSSSTSQMASILPKAPVVSVRFSILAARLVRSIEWQSNKTKQKVNKTRNLSGQNNKAKQKVRALFFSLRPPPLASLGRPASQLGLSLCLAGSLGLCIVQPARPSYLPRIPPSSSGSPPEMASPCSSDRKVPRLFPPTCQSGRQCSSAVAGVCSN